MFKKDRHKKEEEKPVDQSDVSNSIPVSAVSDNQDKMEEEMMEAPVDEKPEMKVSAEEAEKVAAKDQKEPDPEVKYQEMHEKYLRLAAEYDNYRKRTLKEKSDLLKYGGEVVLKNLLSVIDDWERALKTVETAEESDPIKQGIILINNKFKDFLSQNGIKEIEAMEKDFNVDIHEAVTKIPSEDKKGKVVEVLLKGYYLFDKVLRYSKVVVGE